MNHYPMLKGKNIFLSPISPNDVDVFCQWTNDLTTMVSLGIADKPNSKPTQKAILEAMAKDYSFTIVTNNNEIIGSCALSKVDTIHESAEFGIMIGPEDMRGKGYGREATALLCQYGFSILNLHSITLNVFGFNKKAMRTYTSIGFVETGKRSESYYFSGKFYDIHHMELFNHTLTYRPLDIALDKIKENR